MVDENTFQEKVEEIKSYIAEISDDLEKDLSDDKISEEDIVEIDGEKAVSLYADLAVDLNEDVDSMRLICSRGGSTYMIFGSSDSRVMEVAYLFDIRHELASVLGEEQVSSLLNVDRSKIDMGEDDEITEDAQDAADQFLSSIPSEDIRQLTFYLEDRISSPGIGYSIRQEDDGGYLTGFRVHGRLFPYVERFDLMEFDDRIQSVVSVGHKGSRYLSNAFIVDIADAESSAEVEATVNIR